VEEEKRPSSVNVERLGPTRPYAPKPPEHHVCADCGGKFHERDMISDSRARWHCWPCAERVFGVKRDDAA
jgi:hypothetical protein